MADFELSDLINKTLIAKKAVKVYDLPGRNEIGVVQPGNPVGVVYSWVGPDLAGNIYYAFQNPGGVFYYTKHEKGVYDISALKRQGVISVQDKIKEEELKSLPWYEQLIKKYGLTLLLGLGGIYIAGQVIKKKL